MAYYFYLGNVLLPIPPKKLELKISNQNKTYDLMNYSEINVLKSPGLTSIEFDILLPNVKYPFATYKNNFQNAKYFLGILENLKVNKSAFQFIVIRKFPNGTGIFDTNIKVSLEDYTITDSTDEGFDTTVKIKLKQYREYSTKTVKVTIKYFISSLFALLITFAPSILQRSSIKTSLFLKYSTMASKFDPLPEAITRIFFILPCLI